MAAGDMPAGSKAGALEDELEQSLIVFDEQILSARTRVEQPGAPPATEMPPGGSIVPGTSRSMPGEDGELVETQETGSNSEGSVEVSSKEERGGQDVAMNLPDDVGNGQDDDIVAQQLREAAIAEQDPELREKLWEEYRRYKAGQ